MESLDLDAEVAAVRATIRHYGRAPGTEVTYRAHWRRFEDWCDVHGLVALPASPMTLLAYLVERFGAEVSGGVVTLRHRSSSVDPLLGAVRAGHLAVGFASPHADPRVAAFVGLLRTAKQPEASLAKPLRLATLEALAAELPGYRAARRDWAATVLGYFGALRGEEVARVPVSGLAFVGGGMVLELRRSKGNQQGAVERVPIAGRAGASLCPVQVTRDWLATLGLGARWLFPSPFGDRPVHSRAIYEGVRRVTNGGCAEGSPYSTHSLRRGFILDAVEAGHSLTSVARKARHRSATTTLGYIEGLGPNRAAAAVSESLGSDW